MKVLKVKHTKFYDVFIGDGWKNHARVFYDKITNKLTFVGSNNTRLSFSQIQTLKIKLALEGI